MQLTLSMSFDVDYDSDAPEIPNAAVQIMASYTPIISEALSAALNCKVRYNNTVKDIGYRKNSLPFLLKE